MHANPLPTQAPERESRSEKVAIAVTPTEKAAVRAVAAVRGTDESNLVRETPIAVVLAEFEWIREATAAGRLSPPGAEAS